MSIHVAAAVCSFLSRAQAEASASGKKDFAASLQVALDCVKQAFPVSQKMIDQAIPLEEVVSAPDTSDNADDEAALMKEKGNKLMTEQDYAGAYEAYTEAIRLKKDPIYYGNRAAACISLSKFEAAIEDCKASLALNPNYVKSFARMGHAYKALGEHSEALNAFQEAALIDPVNQNYKDQIKEIQSLLNSHHQPDEEPPTIEEPDEEAPTASESQDQNQQPSMNADNPFAAMLGGMGPSGAQGQGGVDLSGLLNNPQIMSMATSMMSNPNMQQMLGNLMSGFQVPQNNQENGQEDDENQEHQQYYS
eukprot:gene1057-4289_t